MTETPCRAKKPAAAQKAKPAEVANMKPAVAAADEDDDQMLPVPPKIQMSGCPVYNVEERLGKGGFGQVYRGRRARRTTKDNKPYEVHANMLSWNMDIHVWRVLS